ncbi:MAG: metal-dependent hydrolase [Desulfobacterales bacterium]|nr:metal-dependent hydrolase [Desulfobacterales bacterium]
MSSFIGHSLTGVALSCSDHQKSQRSLVWTCWLVVLAIFPDSEYGVLWLWGTNFAVRFTHSVVFCSILPLCSLVYLTRYVRPDIRKIRGLQVFGAAYSHLLLDLLVGVYPLPLLWPFSTLGITLPFGVLPSAGRLALTNYYLYRNLVIELGILVPLYSFLLLNKKIRRHQYRLLLLGGHAVVWLPCLVWGFLLKR